MRSAIATSRFLVGCFHPVALAGVLLGQPSNGSLHALVGQQGIDRIILLFQLFVAEKRMDGTVTIAADRQLFFAPATLRYQVMIAGEDHLTLAERAVRDHD
jgi:hypothetical protein